MRKALSPRQKELVDELSSIFQLIHLDFYNAEEYRPELRTDVLQVMLRQVALGEVVRAYTLVDEYLNVALCHYFFGKQRSFIRLWRTQKFRIFNHHVIEELSLLAKLRLVKSIRQVPSGIAKDIERLNALRNGLSHAFFPENLRRVRPEWKGRRIFSVDGMTAFTQDVREIYDYFWKRELAGSANDWRKEL